MPGKFKNIKPRLLFTHLLVTLAYPAARALTAERGGLLLFTDAMTITGLVLIICGVVYALYLRGDFDITAFELRRGAGEEGQKNYKAYLADAKEKREEAFNYPLFLGIIYLLVSGVIAHAFL